MKKALIVLALLGIGFWVYSKNQKPVTPILEDDANVILGDFYPQFNNRVVIDADGRWMLIKDGKIYAPTSIESFHAWQAANPTIAETITSTESIWNNNQDRFAGTF